MNARALLFYGRCRIVRHAAFGTGRDFCVLSAQRPKKREGTNKNSVLGIHQQCIEKISIFVPYKIISAPILLILLITLTELQSCLEILGQNGNLDLNLGSSLQTRSLLTLLFFSRRALGNFRLYNIFPELLS